MISPQERSRKRVTKPSLHPALLEDRLRSAMLNRVAAIAKREAAIARGTTNVRIRPLHRRCFNECVLDARGLLRGVPFKDPPEASELDKLHKALAEARCLASRPAVWRNQINQLIHQISTGPWNIERAKVLQNHPAILALWLNDSWSLRRRPNGSFRFSGVPLFAQNGRFDPRQKVIEWLKQLASSHTGIVGQPGALHTVDGNFDAAVTLLLQAFGLASGRNGRSALAISLSHPRNGKQHDTGPAARFVREAIAVLAPNIAGHLGPQAIAESARRARRLLESVDTNPPLTEALKVTLLTDD